MNRPNIDVTLRDANHHLFQVTIGIKVHDSIPQEEKTNKQKKNLQITTKQQT